MLTGSCCIIRAITSSGVVPCAAAAASAVSLMASVMVMPGTTQLESTPWAENARDRLFE